MPDYPYEGQLIADPVTFQRATNAQVFVYDAADTTNSTPLALKDASGLPTTNPLTSSGDAFVKPIYAPSQDIKYVGAGLTVFVSSAKGMRDAAAASAAAAEAAASSAAAEAAAGVASVVAAAASSKSAAEAAAASAAVSAALVNAPSDSAIAAAINGSGTATKAALSATIVDLAKLPDLGNPKRHGVCLMGQSNQLGRGVGLDAVNFDVTHPRIKQYAGSGSFKGQIITASEPLFHHETPAGTVGFGMEFARNYVETLPQNDQLVLIPTARGNTGIVSSGTYTWDPDVHEVGMTNLFDNAVSQMRGFLATPGAENVIDGILWHQGEANNSTDPATYKARLLYIIDTLRAEFGADIPFVLGQMTPEAMIYSVNLTGYNAINQVHIDLAKEREHIGFWYGTPGMTNNIVDDFIHYSAAGQRLNGFQASIAWALALKNEYGTLPLAPSAPSLVQVGTTINAEWKRPFCRFTDFTVRYRATGAGSWTTWAHTATLHNKAAITGLTLGTTYEVQVATVNEQGTSTFSPSTTLAMLTIPTQVTGLTSTAVTSALVSLQWTAVAGAASYLIEYKASSSGVWLTAGTTSGTTYTKTVLAPSTAYNFRVSATNAAGTGTASATFTTTTSELAPLIDEVGIAARTAYSLNKLRTAYSGSALRVRRSSDSTELDIGFSGTSLDTAALLTFAGTGDAFVKTWYDQSGNAYDLTMTTAANQPKLVTAGVVESGVIFDGTNDYLTNATAGLYAAGVATVFGVVSGIPQANARVYSEGNTATASGQYATLAAGVTADNSAISASIQNQAGTNVTSGANAAGAFDSTIHQVSMVDSGSTIEMRRDETTPTTISYTRSGTLTPNVTSMGALQRSSVGSYYSGRVMEVVSFAVALTAEQRQTVAANQKYRHATP